MGNSTERPLLFSILLVLLLAGNLFAAYQLWTTGPEFLKRIPLLTPTGLNALRILPWLNLISLAGIWFWKRWGVVFAVVLGAVTMGFDVKFGIWYHFVVAVSSVFLLCLGAAWHRDKFR